MTIEDDTLTAVPVLPKLPVSINLFQIGALGNSHVAICVYTPQVRTPYSVGNSPTAMVNINSVPKMQLHPQLRVPKGIT